MKINRSVKNISKFRTGGFRYVTKFLFFYNRSEELKRRYNNIIIWLLIVDDEEEPPMQAILPISFYRKHARSVSEFHKMILSRTPSKTKAEEKRSAKYGRRKTELSYLEVIQDRVLESYNIRRSLHWRIQSVIGWTHGISKFRSTALFTRDKTNAKKKKGKHAYNRR